MSSALSEYDADVHGEEEKGFFARMLERCKKPNSPDDGPGVTRQLSLRMSFALRNSAYVEEEKEAYARMFRHIDKHAEYEITKAQFKDFLKSVGFTDENSLDFACEAFQLMDLDGSGDIGEFYRCDSEQSGWCI